MEAVAKLQKNVLQPRIEFLFCRPSGCDCVLNLLVIPLANAPGVPPTYIYAVCSSSLSYILVVSLYICGLCLPASMGDLSVAASKEKGSSRLLYAHLFFLPLIFIAIVGFYLFSTTCLSFFTRRQLLLLSARIYFCVCRAFRDARKHSSKTNESK